MCTTLMTVQGLRNFACDAPCVRREQRSVVQTGLAVLSALQQQSLDPSEILRVLSAGGRPRSPKRRPSSRDRPYELRLLDLLRDNDPPLHTPSWDTAVAAPRVTPARKPRVRRQPMAPR